MVTPQIAVLVSTFERPHHLIRSLTAISVQKGLLPGTVEVVVTDDGSRDNTFAVVAEFAKGSQFAVHFVTHEHDGFQLARCRNEGARASTAPIILFLDGDCIIPPDFLALCLKKIREGVVTGSLCQSLTEDITSRITTGSVENGSCFDLSRRDRNIRLVIQEFKSLFYSVVRHPTKPKLFGGNMIITRKDYERVNGYDERFQGWGCEDDDLRIRLRRRGIVLRPIIGSPRTCHLWHPAGETRPTVWKEGRNVRYFKRSCRLTRCLDGFVKRSIQDVTISIFGLETQKEMAAGLLPGFRKIVDNRSQHEIEILFHPGGTAFSQCADCNVLVLTEDSACAKRIARKAHTIVGLTRYNWIPKEIFFPLNKLADALHAVTGKSDISPFG